MNTNRWAQQLGMTLVATAPEAQAARKVACASVTYGEVLERGRTRLKLRQDGANTHEGPDY